MNSPSQSSARATDFRPDTYSLQDKSGANVDRSFAHILPANVVELGRCQRA
jgi:hypothetical protein